jgi:hypothetical protein
MHSGYQTDYGFPVVRNCIETWYGQVPVLERCESRSVSKPNICYTIVVDCLRVSVTDTYAPINHIFPHLRALQCKLPVFPITISTVGLQGTFSPKPPFVAMFSKSLIPLAFLFFSSFSLSLAQQYAGRTITNSLPATAGAEIAFFNIKDVNGGNTTLINYFSLPTTGRQNPINVKRAVVVLSGSNRDPWDYYANVYNAVKNAAAIDSSVTQENVAIIAPYWANEAVRLNYLLPSLFET